MSSLSSRPTSVDLISSRRPRRGAIAVLAAVFLVMVFAFTAFTVDVGYISLVDQQLQSAVDSAALAAAQELQIAPDGEQRRIIDAAVNLAESNPVDGSGLELNPRSDIEPGVWNEANSTFVPYMGNDLSLANAVRVTGELNGERQNAVKLFFAPVLGHNTHSVRSSAIAVIGRTRMRDVMLVIDCSGSMSSQNRMLYTRAAALVLIDELGGDDRLGLAVYSYPITETRTVSTGATGGTSRVASRTPSAGAGPAMPAVMARVAPPIASRRRPGRGGRGNSGNAGRGGGNGNGRGNSGNAGRGRGNRNGRGNSGGAGRGRGNGNGRGNSGNAGRGGGNGNGRGNSGNAGRGGGNGNGRGNPGGNGGGSGGSDPESTTRLTGHLENKIDSDFLPVKLRIPDLVPNLYASRTCIGGGMRVAIEELIAKERNNPLGEPVEKVMVLMTDGHANETEPPASNPVASIYYYASLADQHDIIIHGITLGQNAHEEPIRDAAELTGGEYHHVPDGDFEGLFEVYRGIGRGGNQPRLVK